MSRSPSLSSARFSFACSSSVTPCPGGLATRLLGRLHVTPSTGGSATTSHTQHQLRNCGRGTQRGVQTFFSRLNSPYVWRVGSI
eukprot:2655309-Pyramimonas_sp.AAC.1